MLLDPHFTVASIHPSFIASASAETNPHKGINRQLTMLGMLEKLVDFLDARR
jgi:hypothetical protein